MWQKNNKEIGKYNVEIICLYTKHIHELGYA